MMFNIFIKLKKLFQNIFQLERIIDQNLKQKLLIERYEMLSLSSEVSGVTEELFLENKELIISLTTYGERIEQVYLTIESLMQQTQKPNRIILWLSQDEFNSGNIPLILKCYEARGLTIDFCPDIRSYKKLIPSLIRYPNANIITVDDDVIYLRYFIENLCAEHKKNPDCIIFNRGHKITFNNKGNIKPYLDWEWEIQDTSKSLLHVPTGNGGIFYPVNCFSNEVLESNIFMSICPTTDDIWFKAMSLIKGVKCIKAKHVNFIEISVSSTDGLNKYNNGTRNINDENLKVLIPKYHLLEILKQQEVS